MHCSIAHTENLAVSEMTKSVNCCMRRFFLSPPFIRRPPTSGCLLMATVMDFAKVQQSLGFPGKVK